MSKKEPLRRCVGCNEMKDKSSLLRVVKNQQGNVSIDTTSKINGRGAYVCKHSECFQKALKTRGIQRSLKLQLPKEIEEQLIEEMKQFDTE